VGTRETITCARYEQGMAEPVALEVNLWRNRRTIWQKDAPAYAAAQRV